VVTPVIGAPGSDVDHLVRSVLLSAYGDADLDGVVNLEDFNTLAANFGSSGRGWALGNFSGDPAGLVNLDDFNLLAAHFGFDAGADGVVDPDDWAALVAAVPEPGHATLVVTALIGMPWRRQRRAR
jgi:hypothetical protein